MHFLLQKLASLNALIAAKLHINTKLIFRLELGGLVGSAFTLAGIGEWAAAIACWLLLAAILLVRVLVWKGFRGNKGITAFMKVFAAAFVIAVCSLAILITELRKPEDEPWSNLQKWSWPEHQLPCSVSVSGTSEILDRVHSRAMWTSDGSTEVYKAVFQDLFHDWTIRVVPTRSVSPIIVSIRDARKPIDRIRVEPSGKAVVSEPKPGWMSGFDEPTQVPDFYVTTIIFTNLDKPATIVSRKPIKSRVGENTITTLDLDLDRQIEASAGRCKLELTSFPPMGSPAGQSRFQDLVGHIRAFVAQKLVNGSPVPTRLDPDEPYPSLGVHESEMVTELRCTDSPCSKMTVAMTEKSRVH